MSEKQEKKFTLTESQLKALTAEAYEKGLIKGQPMEEVGTFDDAQEYSRKTLEELLGLKDNEGVE